VPQRILAATDSPRLSRKAVQYAIELAANSGGAGRAACRAALFDELL